MNCRTAAGPAPLASASTSTSTGECCSWRDGVALSINPPVLTSLFGLPGAAARWSRCGVRVAAMPSMPRLLMRLLRILGRTSEMESPRSVTVPLAPGAAGRRRLRHHGDAGLVFFADPELPHPSMVSPRIQPSSSVGSISRFKSYRSPEAGLVTDRPVTCCHQACQRCDRQNLRHTPGCSCTVINVGPNSARHEFVFVRSRH